MKITAGQLRQIIKEELTRVLLEERSAAGTNYDTYDEYVKAVLKILKTGYDEDLDGTAYTAFYNSEFVGNHNFSAGPWKHPDPVGFLESGAPHFGVSKLGNIRRLEITTDDRFLKNKVLVYQTDGFDHVLAPSEELDGLQWLYDPSIRPSWSKRMEPVDIKHIDGEIRNNPQDFKKLPDGKYGEERYEVDGTRFRNLSADDWGNIGRDPGDRGLEGPLRSDYSSDMGTPKGPMLPRPTAGQEYHEDPKPGTYTGRWRRNYRGDKK